MWESEGSDLLAQEMRALKESREDERREKEFWKKRAEEEAASLALIQQL